MLKSSIAALAASGLAPSAFADPPLAGPLTISTWPYYIDKDTIPNFEKAFGVDVKYIEDINDNDSLFGKIAGSLMQEKRIRRSSYGGARPLRDFPMLAQAALDGRLRLDELITARISLEQVNDGFDALKRGAAIRGVVVL